ncbi:MAG: glycosyltransferase [Cryomorphaceae bacterium]|nr:glycosyltransferase [Cryomorphaceae bacterium]
MDQSLTIVLITTVAILFVVQLIYIIRFLRFKSLTFKNDEVLPPISVVVVGRNEAKNWKMLIPALLSQSHHTFEVVAVSDRSSDESVDVISQFMLEDTRIRLVDVEVNEAFVSGKKYALTLGIKAARYEHLLFIDTDCLPADEHWIREMAKGFSKGDIVLGFGDYQRLSGFLNRLIRWETLHTAMMYFSAASSGKAYMGIGRNLAYTKSLFFAVKGFYEHMHLPMGDDDLFVNKSARLARTAWVTTTKTISEPKRTWRAWWKQKRRHMASSSLYRKHTKLYLATYAMSKVFLYIGLLMLMLTELIPVAVIMLFLYIGMISLSMWHVGNHWKVGVTALFSFIIDPLLVVLQGVLMLQNYFTSPPKTWK